MRKLLLAASFALAVIALLATAYPPSTGLKGIILYNHAVQPLQPLAVSSQRTICGESVPNETLVVHKKGGLQNVLVFLANIKPEKLPPLELDLQTLNCRFQPHVLALGVGSQLTIHNNDPMLHNVHARLHEFIPGWDQTSTLDIFQDTDEASFNFAFSQKGGVAVDTLNQPGLIRLRSDAGYEWMSGYILVMPHRYFTVTDAEGKFQLPELPPERYDLVMWHETLGVKRQIVDVKAGDKNELLIKWFPEETASTPDTTKAN
jgi:plastocyanin